MRLIISLQAFCFCPFGLDGSEQKQAYSMLWSATQRYALFWKMQIF
jgi:hypothetical protein